MKFYQKLFLAVVMITGIQTQMLAQCNLLVEVYGDTLNCHPTYLEAYPVGGSAPYTYSWNTGATSGTVTNPMEGMMHTITITDANGCTAVESYYVDSCGTQPCNLQAYIYDDSSNCGASYIGAYGIGGSAPYTYSWNTGATSGIVTNPMEGMMHTVTITDANGCTAVESYYVDSCGVQPCNLLVDVYGDTLNCHPTYLEAYPVGGSAPYTYSWNTGATSGTVTNPMEGMMHTITITDANGCTAVESYYVDSCGVQPCNLQAYIYDDSSNCGASYIGAYGIGGSAPYTYSWNTGATSGTVTNPMEGMMHTVTITDANGCTAVESYYVDSCGVQPCNLQAYIYDDNSNCGASYIGAYGIGGSAPYTYSWNTGATSGTVTNPMEGMMHTVTITDANGCTAVESYYVDSCGVQPCNLQAYISPDTSFGSCPVTALYAYNSNSTPPYTYNWSNGATSRYVSGLTPGVYAVTVTDANGCTAVSSINLSGSFTLSATTQDASCFMSNGAIDLTITSADTLNNYSFLWSNGEFTEDVSGLSAGLYSVLVFDDLGCVQLLDSLIVDGFGVTESITPEGCNQNNGAISVNVTGISFPIINWYGFDSTGNWTSLGNGTSITGLSAGTYRVMISDPADSACAYYNSFEIPNDTTCLVTISGTLYNIDSSGTCTASNNTIAYRALSVKQNGVVVATIWTDWSGSYNFVTNIAGTYTVELVELNGQTVLCPSTSAYTVAANLGSVYSDNNFYLTSPSGQDVSIDIIDYGFPIPGRVYFTSLKFCNHGNVSANNGTIDYTHDELLEVEEVNYSFINNISGHSYNAATNTLTFNYNSIAAGECETFWVDFITDTTATVEDSLCNSAIINTVSNNDISLANNSDFICQGVRNSYDPNDKRVAPYHAADDVNGGIIYPDENELTYTINFENLGTGTAYQVVIRDVLDANLLPNTIRKVVSSHDATVSLNGNVLTVKFENINLAAAGQNSGRNKGFISFSINRVAGLPIGTEITNDAAIYFDYNPAIITNNVKVTVNELSSVQGVDYESNIDLNVYPNPFDQSLTVEYNLVEDTDVTIALYDVLGSRLKTYVTNETQAVGTHNKQIRTTDLAPAVYFLSIETKEGRILQKVVKQ